MLLSNGSNFQIPVMETEKKTLLKTFSSIFRDSYIPENKPCSNHFSILLIEVVSSLKLVHEGLGKRLPMFKM